MHQRNDLHESFHRDDAGDAVAGERAFGLVFATVFGLIALWPLLSGGGIRLWSTAIAAVFLASALLRPALLRPASALWQRLGRAMHHVVSPLVLGMLFYLTVVPTGLVMRALGKDPLRLRFDRAAQSYWIERRPPGPAPESLRNQF
jgi:hypothetical protein